MSRVLLVSPEVVGARMAGPGLRFWNMAATLARAGNDVTLAIEDRSELAGSNFAIVAFTQRMLRDLVARADVVAVQGWTLRNFPEVRGRAPLVVDLYDPFHIEAFESYRQEPERQRLALAAMSRAVVWDQIEAGDFFLCASERQRIFWLGHLALLGRLTPQEHDRDPTFRSLIDLAPSGVDAEPPRSDGAVLKGRRHGIGDRDRVVLWTGGIYDWLDPFTVIKAFARVAASFPDAHLVFLGARHPNPAVPPQNAVEKAEELVKELGVPRVHFHDEWVPFGRRGSLLLEADIGVSAHPDTLEAQLAYRTRLLDHIWSGLPTVATHADEVTSAIVEAGGGLAVPAGDDRAMAEALADLLGDDARRQAAAGAARSLAPRFSWERQLRTLVEFCAAPRRAQRPPARSGGRLRQGVRLTRRFAHYARAGEWRMAMNRVRATLQRRR